jgi:NodT family efflux transporter outer membrane factor (OMF) lipoprotein
MKRSQFVSKSSPYFLPRSRGRLLFCLVALACMGLISCSIRDRTIESTVPLPKAFSATGIAKLPDRWWECFNDTQLNSLVERALDGNLNLRMVWDRLNQTQAVARKQGAALWPSLNGEAGADRTAQREEIASGSNARQTTYTTSLSLDLVASYEVDLWGRIGSARDAAILDVKATEAQLTAAAITLSAEVALTWYQLVEQYGQIDLLGGQLKTNEDVLELVTLRFRRGQTGAADVLRQRQLVESVRGNLTTAESSATVLEHQLALLTGQPPKNLAIRRVAELSSLPPMPDTGVPASLIQCRPDIQQAYYDVLAADRRLAAAVTDRFPRISLSARVNTSGEATRDLFHNWLASLAANMMAPIFDADLRRAEVDRTRSVVSERLHSYGQTILTALNEVENALVREDKQRELIQSLEKQVVLSRQVIERTRDSYTKGALDYLRVLDALLSQQSLQRDYLQAQRQLIAYRINLCRALGSGWAMTAPPTAELSWRTKPSRN